MTTTTNRNTQTVPTLAEHIQSAGQAAAYIAIRARAQYSEDLADLQAQQYNDRRREALPDYAAEALTLRAEADQLRELAQAAQEQADRLHKAATAIATSQSDRAQLEASAKAIAQTAAKYRREAAALVAEANDIEQYISDTSTSDRADIVQAATAAYLEAMTDYSPAYKASRRALALAVRVYKADRNQTTAAAVRAAKAALLAAPKYAAIDWSNHERRNEAFYQAIKLK